VTRSGSSSATASAREPSSPHTRSSTSTKSGARKLNRCTTAGENRLNVSTTVRMPSFGPVANWSWTKSMAHTLALREISLRSLADREDLADLREGRLFLHPRARQFAKRVAAYTAMVMKLPVEFADVLGQSIDQVVEAAEKSGALPKS